MIDEQTLTCPRCGASFEREEGWRIFGDTGVPGITTDTLFCSRACQRAVYWGGSDPEDA